MSRINEVAEMLLRERLVDDEVDARLAALKIVAAASQLAPVRNDERTVSEASPTRL